ncbi:unnamed protein product [Staurois parvus]|uniref:Uncharacterized protein n=1 Tax=Staurois parvus TaxID=386267 RepID=A0ABN9DJ06_9NEOB|nr:unnamed protein product [Staurois parvus]
MSWVQQLTGSEVPEEQAENGQGHMPGSVTHGQRGTEDLAEGWSGKPGVKQGTVNRVRNNAEVGNRRFTGYQVQGLMGNNTPRH